MQPLPRHRRIAAAQDNRNMLDLTAHPTVLELAAALLLGSVIGLERGWRDRERPEGSRVAGLRTFSLIGLFGGILGVLTQEFGALLAAMGLPEELLTVVQEHELEHVFDTVGTLAEVLFVANRLANVQHGWRDDAYSAPPDAAVVAQLFAADELEPLLAESADDVASLKAALGGQA